MAILLTVVLMLGCAAVGSAIGHARRRAAAGWWLGFLLGPLGCLAALFLPKENK